MEDITDFFLGVITIGAVVFVLLQMFVSPGAAALIAAIVGAAVSGWFISITD